VLSALAVFHEYLGRHGDRAIAAGLNRDGIPCPSAHRRDQNKHRFVDGWQGSAVRAILENPRYTGYAVFGWWSKHDTLLDPDDVPAGHLERFRRAAVDRVVRSRRPAHPAIISVAEFIEAQLLRRSRAAGGLDARAKLERGPKPTKLGLSVATLRTVNRSLNRLVAATPASRDRTVDLLRAFSIGVVVVWHWVLSVTHRQDGEFVMANPIAEVPLAWLATWLLQVIPVFFLVGGFVNLTAWDRTEGDARPFLRRRLIRLLRPAAVFLAVWVVAEAVLLVAVPGYPGVVSYGLIVAVPLWFLAAYLWVVLLVPLTASAHRRAAVPAVVLLGAAVVTVDLARFGAGLEAFGLVNSALVWVFVHQLGYLWRDGMLESLPRRWALVVAGLTGLVVVAVLDVYPRSMVATVGDERSHMYPTTVGIATLAVFQLGVMLLLRPVLSSWLRRRRVWKAVVAINAVIMTVFLWHTTALLMALALVEVTGLPIHPEPTAAWWAQRPLWLLVPGVLLAALVALFARAETRLPGRF